MMAETREEISNAEVVTISIILATVVLLGCVLNSLILTTYVKWYHSLLVHSTDVLVINLAFSGLLLSALASPLALASTVLREWISNYTGCMLYGFLTTWVGLSSIILLAAIAVERHITLSRATQVAVPMSHTVKVTAACWLIALLSSCCPFMGWSKYTFEGYGFHCSILWDSEKLTDTTYGIFLLVFYFVFPVVAIVFSYTKIYFTTKAMYLNASELWGKQAQQTKDSHAAQAKTVKQLSLLIAGFMIAWTPYAVVALLRVIGGFHLSTAFKEYPSLFAKASAIFNPFIIFLSYRRLRQKSFKFLISMRKATLNGSQYYMSNITAKTQTQAEMV